MIAYRFWLQWKKFFCSCGNTLITLQKELLHAYAKAVINLKKVQVRTKKEKKRLRKRFKKACRTCWLSTEQLIDSVFEDYEALLQTLRIFEEDGDATATGLPLLTQVENIKFLGAVYLLHKTLPKLSNLSKAFQKGAVSFAAVSPAVDYTLDELDSLANNFSFISDLKNDLKEDGRLSRCHLGVFIYFCKNFTPKYIKVLKENIQIDLMETSLLSLHLKYSIPLEFLRRKKLDLKSMEYLRLKCWQTTSTTTQKKKKTRRKSYSASGENLSITFLICRRKFLQSFSGLVGTGKHGTNKFISRTPTEWLLEHMLSFQ
jgi:hypothetical protein